MGPKSLPHPPDQGVKRHSPVISCGVDPPQVWVLLKTNRRASNLFHLLNADYWVFISIVSSGALMKINTQCNMLRHISGTAH